MDEPPSVPREAGPVIADTVERPSGRAGSRLPLGFLFATSIESGVLAEFTLAALVRGTLAFGVAFGGAWLILGWHGWLQHMTQLWIACAVPFLLLAALRARVGDWLSTRALALVVLVGTLFGALVAAPVPLLPNFPADRLATALAGQVLIGWAFALGVTLLQLSFGWVLLRQRRASDARARQILLEREVLAARLSVLQAQIEPHFLYNTLANVQALARTDVRSSDTMLGHLIDYLRSAMPAMRAGTSTLGREFDLARAYLAIMRFRMGERLQFSVHAPAELVGHEFPPTLVGTLVENAVKHGLERSAAGGRIDVAASVDGSAVPPRLVVEVTDTGLGFSASSGSGVGLANARERLSLLYGADADLELMPNPSALTGISARVRIPLKRDQIRRSDADRLAA
jgi:hypothetical protein